VTRRRLNREEQKAVTRAHLLAAARHVFARRGFDGASIDEIAEQAGYSHGAVYSNFSGKEELFLAVYEEFIKTRGQEIAGPLEQEDFVAGARAAASRWMERITDDPEGYLLRIEFGLFALRDPRLRGRFAAQLGLNRELIARLLERRIADLGVKPPLGATELAGIVRALGIGLAIERVVDPDAIPAELFADAVEWIIAAAGLDGTGDESHRAPRA
jgi:AcrR family transcriptional regulator